MSGGGRLHALVLCGGAGERFWPASRQRRPKPFLEIFDGRTILDATLTRARRFAGRERVWVVCGAEHARAIRRATGLPARRVLVEPLRRNTAMACGFAAARIAAEDPEAVLGVLPADHRIPDTAAFVAALRRAAGAARDAAVLVCLGVKPTRPDPGLGYIQLGDPVEGAHPGLHRVRRFVEKPAARRARRFLRSGGYLWNAGIFAWSARTLLEELERLAPRIHAALEPVCRAGRRGLPAAELRTIFHQAPSEPIDVAVMEKSRRVWTLPVQFHWRDVGTWASLAEELGVGPGLSRVVKGDLAYDDAGGNLVWSPGRTVALLGVQGLAVIDTGDALLVARLDRSAEVRDIVAALKKKGRADVT